MPTISIVRGLPGSGKSTFARNYKGFNGAFHIEADMFHVQNAVYDWQPNKVSSAHTFCKLMAAQAMAAGCDVVVSNTFTRLWEVLPYVDMAAGFNYTYRVFLMTTQFLNQHDVPEHVISNMRARLQTYEGEIIVDDKFLEHTQEA